MISLPFAPLAATALAVLSFAAAAPQQDVEATMPGLPSLREQAELRDGWLLLRLERLLPRLMRRENIDLWIVCGREYNEDPVLETMLPARWLSARRRTILVFHDAGEAEGVERLTVSRYAVRPFYDNAWDPDGEPDQWAALAAILEARDPRRIGLDLSADFAHADGMTATELEALRAALPGRLATRIVSAESLALGWLETRIEEEMEWYPVLCRIAHRIIAEGFSTAAIEPGVTSTEDVLWRLRERMAGLGLATWFHPSISVQRQERAAEFSPADGFDARIIQPGDLLHVDLGIVGLGLATDTQQHAYVLRPGEQDAPAGLHEALAAGNRAQDLLLGEFEVGRSGNEVLAAALAACRDGGLEASIYSHPLGYHGHGAGPAIGLWDQQDGVPGGGDPPLHLDTAWSIELNVRSIVPEWKDQEIRVMLEEDAFLSEKGIDYIDGRQTELILIPSPSQD